MRLQISIMWIWFNQIMKFIVLGGRHVIQCVFHEDVNPLIRDFIKDRPGENTKTVNINSFNNYYKYKR